MLDIDKGVSHGEAANLETWQHWLTKFCPVSVGNPAPLWQRIISNTASNQELEAIVRSTEIAGPWHVQNSKSYLAAHRLLDLREVGMLSRPVEIAAEEELR